VIQANLRVAGVNDGGAGATRPTRADSGAPVSVGT
jgi:hypothetical protein